LGLLFLWPPAKQPLICNRKRKGMLIKTIELQTNNLEGTEAFYSSVLQLPVIAKTAAAISFKVGYSTLTFKATSNNTGIYHFAILIPKNTVTNGHQWLKNRTPFLPFNAEGDIANFTNWNAQAFYFHDPNQNIIELIAHADLPHTWNSDFSADAFIGICEMGLVVADVAAACKMLHEKFDVPYFDKGPYLADFAVMGEEDGLLIVSAEDRGWLPTGQPAKANHLKLTLQVDEREREISMQGLHFDLS
jgi:catechol-2,3-dioxygenase